MPECYCSACKRTTTHKSVMCREQVDCASSLGQIVSSITQIFRGNHYHEMKAKVFCRECNCEYIQTNSQIKDKPLSSPVQVSAL